MKGVDSISFDYTKTVINIAFPHFRLYFRRVDGYLFNRFHAQVRNHRADRAAHRATMDLFVYLVIIDEIVIG